MEERGLAPTTVDRCYGLLRLYLLPAFGSKNLDEITPPSVRTWRAERLKTTGATTVAKWYRLLKAIRQTAVDDDLLRTNACRIKGVGREEADERPTATVEQGSTSPTPWARAGAYRSWSVLSPRSTPRNWPSCAAAVSISTNAPCGSRMRHRS
ncbi:hypothetical protein GCM10010478_31040 [Streptomyces erythrogriseus]|uniref:Core-binding (CB) domain-containing protein n=1 Tax=Streptomyces erythrogriseus TaxID=284027 RepID=A0ABN3WX98_9ACTN